METDADIVAVGCPFCMTMLEDGINARKGDRDVKVLDVAELSGKPSRAPRVRELPAQNNRVRSRRKAPYMDLSLTPSELKFRDELRVWLAANAPPKATGSTHATASAAAFHQQIKDWQGRLFAGGYAGIAWPKEFGGRGATFIEQAIFQEEMALADTPETATIGLSLVGPTIIAVGTEAQKKRYLPGILSGEEVWCQGFSEPNAGSDLASLETKAVLDGDHFVINGQKIWTSFAHFADLCLLVVRTDPSAAKHKGITCLLVDMKSPGITVRPLR